MRENRSPLCGPLCKYNEWLRDSWELLTIIVPHCFDSTIFYGPISTSTRPGLFLPIRVERTRRVDEVLNEPLTFKRPGESHHCRSYLY